MVDIFMEAAIEEARKGLEEGGIPIGSVIVHDGKIIGRGHNRRVQKGSAVLHGEMDALENTGRQPASIFKSIHFTMKHSASLLHSSIVTSTYNFTIMYNNGANWNSPL